MIRPRASCSSVASMAVPSTAFSHMPEVRRRSKPSVIMCVRASLGLLVRSKARWKVTDIGLARASRRRLASMSTSPCSVRQPKTTPSTPSSLHIRMSSSMRSSSRGEYRKSPPRGRMMTCRRVVVSSLRAVFISPYEGVVPPSGMPAHSSTLSAPPSCAARQLSTPLAHTSNSKSSLLIARSC